MTKLGLHNILYPYDGCLNRRVHYLSVLLLLLFSETLFAATDPDIEQAMSEIREHCGDVVFTRDWAKHKDFTLKNNQYCDCYSFLWSKRDQAPFNKLQHIYHEPSSCNAPHQHLQKHDQCFNGKLNYAIDDDSDVDCWADNPNDIDRTFRDTQCNSPGAINQLRNTCNNLDGTIVIHAEDFVENIPRSNHAWEFRDWPTKFGWSGGGAMQSLPKLPHANFNSNYTTTSPELRYPVRFPQAGTYYVWVYAWGDNGNEDSVHAGLNGVGQLSADRVSGCGLLSPGWKWCNDTMDGVRASIYVPHAGLHTFNIWMRENGFRFDKIHLTKDPNYIPPLFLHQYVWGDNACTNYKTPIGASGKPLWNDTTTTDCKTTKLATGAVQTYFSVISGNTLYEAMWVDQKGFSREVPVRGGQTQWQDADPWREVGSGGSFQAQGGYALGQYLYQHVWESNQCTLYKTPLDPLGKPLWAQTTLSSCSTTAPTGGTVQTYFTIIIGGKLHEAMWQNGIGFTREIKLNADKVLWQSAQNWREVGSGGTFQAVHGFLNQ